MIKHQNEYFLPNGQVISIQINESNGTWEVACWNADESTHWYKEYGDEGEARAEFERWRP